MKASTKAFLRSIPGQLLLLAMTFVGAMGLAVTAILLRGILFEPYVREKYPLPDAGTQKFIESLREGNAQSETLEKLIDREALRLAQSQGPIPEEDRAARASKYRPQAVKQVLAACYGCWMTDPESENNHRILNFLLGEYVAETRDLLLRTLVVGNLEQKLLALDGVNWLNQENPEQAIFLLDYARQQAIRRGDAPIIAKCDQILSEVKRE